MDLIDDINTDVKKNYISYDISENSQIKWNQQTVNSDRLSTVLWGIQTRHQNAPLIFQI